MAEQPSAGAGNGEADGANAQEAADEAAVGGNGSRDEGAESAPEAPIDQDGPSADEMQSDAIAASEAAAAMTATPTTPVGATPAFNPVDRSASMPLDGVAAASATESDAAAAAAARASALDAMAANMATARGAGGGDAEGAARATQTEVASINAQFAAQNAESSAQGPAQTSTQAAAQASAQTSAQASAQSMPRESARPSAESQREASAPTPASANGSQSMSASADSRASMGDDGNGNQSGNQSNNPSGNQTSAQQDPRGAAANAALDARQAVARAEQALAAAAQAAERPAATVSKPTADAVAGRLSEVEATVARDRVVNSLEQGLFSIESNQGDTSAFATMGSNAAQSAMALSVSADGSAISAAMGEPAADLARPSLDPAPTGRLAAKGIDILSNQRGGAITMRLEPPALGQLRIQLQISQGAVVADFTAATPEARVLLEANLGMLRERLESQGLAVERMTVHGGRGSESAPVATASHGGELRQDQGGSGSDARDRGDKSGGRQDAAGGESRGRRDGEQGRDRDSRDGRREETSFFGMFEAQRAQDGARRMRKAV